MFYLGSPVRNNPKKAHHLLSFDGFKRIWAYPYKIYISGSLQERLPVFCGRVDPSSDALKYNTPTKNLSSERTNPIDF